MRRIQILWTASILLSGATLFGGCASDDGAQGGGVTYVTDTETVEGATRIPDDTFDETCCTKRALDLNRDQKPDAYQFFARSKTDANEIVVLRKEIDVNFDGTIDLVRNFDYDGNLVSERLDTDFDKRIDVVNFFEKGIIVRKEYDTNFDNNVDVWRYYDKGIISRKEADLNNDGKTDYWEYYEEGKIDRVGIDRNADGEVDEWETMHKS